MAGRAGVLRYKLSTFAFSSVVKSRSPLSFQFSEVTGLRCVLLSSSVWRSSAFQNEMAPEGRMAMCCMAAWV